MKSGLRWDDTDTNSDKWLADLSIQERASRRWPGFWPTSGVGGRAGSQPGFAASDAAVLFGYTTHPSGTRAGNPTRIS